MVMEKAAWRDASLELTEEPKRLFALINGSN